jgi:hypothetical protein
MERGGREGLEEQYEVTQRRERRKRRLGRTRWREERGGIEGLEEQDGEGRGEEEKAWKTKMK